MDKFELQKLRDLPIEGVAERLGLQVSRHKCLCPFHEDHHPSLSFSVRKNTYRCFVCGASGGTIDLVMRHLNLDFKAACRWLADEHNIILEKCTIGSVPLCTQEKPFDASRYERYFERPFLNDEARHFLFEERRLDERVVRWCRLTSWRDKQGVPWLQIPYYNREGKLVGVQNRRLRTSPDPFFASKTSQAPSAEGGEFHAARGCNKPSSPSCDSPSSPSGRSGEVPRFRFPCGSQCGIYNLPVLNLLRPGEELYIAEGCSDCWSLLSAGHKAIAIPSATLLTKKDKEQLLTLYSNSSPLPSGGAGGGSQVADGSQFAGGFHMWPDNDAPGERLFLQLKEVLPSLVHHQLPPDCKDYSDYYLRYLCQKR